MDWTIVVSVLVALLLFPVALTFVGALVFLTATTVFRGRVREFKGHLARCKRMCDSEERATTCAAGESASCQGATS